MRIPFSKIEFYITNVCNLTCDHCNRFNNYDFRGWQAWSDYEDTYRRWTDLIDLKALTIMGGEPTLNPTLVDWIYGLNRVFGIEVQVLTNGTRINKVRGLYEAILAPTPNGKPNSIAVSLHNMADLPQLKSDIHDFLKPPIYENTHRPDLWGSDFQFSDSNGVFINVFFQNQFDTSSIISRPDGTRTLHSSEPELAHKGCTYVKFKSYHFIRGQLFKCGPAALMPEFDLQHPFDITEREREILHRYQPLTVDNFAHYHVEFIKQLQRPIEQCRFCPQEKKTIHIAPVRKGILP